MCFVFSPEFCSLLAAGNVIKPVARAEVGSRKGLSDKGSSLTGDPGTGSFGVGKSSPSKY